MSEPVRPWRRLGSRTVVHDRWMELRAEHWETARGITLDPWWVLGWTDWVHVVALTPDDRLVLVRQFRPGAAQPVLELPGGVVERTESDPLAAARREFREETGYEASEFRPILSPFVEPAHAVNRVHFVLALGVVPGGPQRLDAAEDIHVETLPVAEVLAGLGQGLVLHATHIGGLLLGLRMAGRIGFGLR